MPSTSWTDLPADVLAILRQGAVLPAHPLALDDKRKFDRQSQRALSRYYIDAGAGGLAVGVHATSVSTARCWSSPPRPPRIGRRDRS
jgi:hypothetical protein